MNHFNKETLLYGCEIGKPDYMEEILYQSKGYVNHEELMKEAKVKASQFGYDRLRISVVDLSIPPDFKKAINL